MRLSDTSENVDVEVASSCRPRRTRMYPYDTRRGPTRPHSLSLYAISRLDTKMDGLTVGRKDNAWLFICVCVCVCVHVPSC